jgi:hypothetical protein
MTIPNTGSLSAQNIEDEFPDNCIDNGPPTALSEYRGVQIKKGNDNINLPTGEISYSDFRNASYGYEISIIMIGGGGGGGNGESEVEPARSDGLRSRSGGGGGAGEYVEETIFVIPGSVYNFTVGAGGDANGGKGGTTRCSLISSDAKGGGGGGSSSSLNGNPRPTNDNFASGGGGGSDRTNFGKGGIGTKGRGKNGGNGSKLSASCEGGGGGGYTSAGKDAIIGIGGQNGEGGDGISNLNGFFGSARFRFRRIGVCGGGGGGRSTGFANSTLGGAGARHGGGKGCMPTLNKPTNTFKISTFVYDAVTGEAEVTLQDSPPDQYNQQVRIRNLPDDFFDCNVICEWKSSRKFTANFGLHPNNQNIRYPKTGKYGGGTDKICIIPVGEGNQGFNLTGGGGGGGCGDNGSKRGGGGCLIIKYPKCCNDINVSFDKDFGDNNYHIVRHENNNFKFIVIGEHRLRKNNTLKGSFTIP